MRLPGEVKALVGLALREDIGSGDITSQLLASTAPGLAEIIARQRLVVAGGFMVQRVFLELDRTVEIGQVAPEGKTVEVGERILLVRGPERSIFTAERTALNFLGHLSGIATLTRLYVEAVEGTGVQIADTRKTIPGLRWLEKYAVRTGGGINHRFGLYDEVMVKNNHVDAAGGMRGIVESFRRARPPIPLAIECRDLQEAEEAVKLPPDLLMVDNLGPGEVRRIVEAVGGLCPIEATGGVNLETVRRLAETGIDRISIGRLTHSAPVADVSLRWMKRP